METREDLNFLETVRAMPILEVAAEALAIRDRNPIIYTWGMRLADELLEAPNSQLCARLAGSTEEREVRVRYACLMHALGKISLENTFTEPLN